ncbi:hypothetical protein SO802_006551 [Lithocarpus litseifolius]|uniref:MULE transposase domain-containing protein n=1 Tax=Lithocarpus litseifolius TaxID=425828 RepID=A0AAW2DPA6_9ROSI
MAMAEASWLDLQATTLSHMNYQRGGSIPLHFKVGFSMDVNLFFKDRIVFAPIEIKGDKHVKIIFDRINSTPQLKAAKLYISVERRAEVGGEYVQQTILEGGGGEELQSLHANGHPTLTPCTTVRDTLPCHETPTPMEVCKSSYQQECRNISRGEDEGDVDHGRDEYEEMIGKDDFHEYVDHYENVENAHNDVVDDHDDDAMEFHDDIGDHIGKLLIAMATDANNEIFPFAFAVEDDETRASWGCFLSCLQTAIQHVVPDSGNCIISDRHRAIIAYNMFANHESNSQYASTGKASLRFQLINQRADFSFALFSGGLANVCS